MMQLVPSRTVMICERAQIRCVSTANSIRLVSNSWSVTGKVAFAITICPHHSNVSQDLLGSNVTSKLHERRHYINTEYR